MAINCRRAILAILLYWAGATSAVAQVNACYVLGQLSTVEAAIFEMSNHNPAEINTVLRNIKILLSNADNRPEVFDQITHDPAWVDRFFESRGRFLSLYLGGQYYQANNLKSSNNFNDFGPMLKQLNSAFFCSPDGPSEGSNSDGQIEEHAKPIRGESWLLRAMRTAKSTVVRLLAKSNFVLIPVLVFLSLILAVWAMIRLDERRRSCKRRYFCEIDVVIRYHFEGRNFTRKGQIIDISRSGAGFSIQDGMPEKIIVEITTKNGASKMRVVRSSGNYAGAAFTKTLKEIPKEFAITSERKFVPRREYIKTVAAQKSDTGG